MAALSVSARAEDHGFVPQDAQEAQDIGDALLLQEMKIRVSRRDIVTSQEQIATLQDEAAFMGGQSATQWAAIATLGTVSTVQAVAVKDQAVRIDLEAARNDQQDTALASTEERLDDGDQKDAQQDAALEKVTKAVTKAAPKSNQDSAQNARLDLHQSQIDRNTVDIGDMKEDLRDQQSAINAHSALLSEHSAKLGQLSEGIAMAMSLPDTWLSDLERYAIAGNVATYDGHTALGAAFIARLNSNVSINLKGSVTSDFNQFGASVGARYGW